MAEQDNQGGGATLGVEELTTANQQLTDQVAALAADKALLEAHAGDLQQALDKASDEKDGLQQQLAQKNDDIFKIDQIRVDLAEQLAQVTGERDKLQAAVVAAEDAAAAAPAEVDKIRKVGPVKDQPGAADLLELIKAGSSVQLAFSDGKKEIAGLNPLDITGNAWFVGPVGLALRVPDLTIVSSAGGQVNLAGYGLFIDGELEAYTSRMDVLPIHPGRRFDITHDVVFP